MSKNKDPEDFKDLPLEEVAKQLRKDLQKKDIVLLYAFNGIGKTRLSRVFKEQREEPVKSRDTLYFNAYTEDLFTWENDLTNDNKRYLKLNHESEFFYFKYENDLLVKQLEEKIRSYLKNCADFDFRIDSNRSRKLSQSDKQMQVTLTHDRVFFSADDIKVIFKRSGKEYIKISRGEQNIFIWCFFLMMADISIETIGYGQAYLYIDDPISSLDEHHAITVAYQLVDLLKKKNEKVKLKIVISSHHTLFFNVLSHQFERERARRYFLIRGKEKGTYTLKNIGKTPFFYHIAMLAELYKAKATNNIYGYHFAIFRNIMETTAVFHGHKNWSDCLKEDNRQLYRQILNTFTHGDHSLFQTPEIPENYKGLFKEVLSDFIKDYKFNIENIQQLVGGD